MCAACVAQGIGYVGTALASLQVMGARAKAKRRSDAAYVDADDRIEEPIGPAHLLDVQSGDPVDA